MKLDKFQKKAIENANKYFSNTLIVKYNLEPLDISKGIDWDYKSKKSVRTFQVYLHSLSFVNDLLTAGLTLRKEKYIKEAKSIILNWYKNNSGENLKWNEHAVATRVRNIIDFQEEEHKFKLPQKIYTNILNKHCEFLFDETNYKMNNHGLMMDTALLYASSVLEDNKLKKIYLDKAMYRIRYSFYRDFSRKGVHLENSPEYHRLVIILYRKILEGLKRHDYKMDDDLQSLIENAKEFNRYMIKPNMTYPLIGDTGLIEQTKLKKIYKDFIDYEAGLAILNSERVEDTKESSYITFKSGYARLTHKHFDDLSLTYYNFGSDILIDPGKYNYDNNDPIRKFIVSPEAHNTVSVKNKEYKLNNPFKDQNRLKLTRFVRGNGYKLVSGINNLYEGVSIIRHTIFTNDDILFVIDGVGSNKEEVFNLNFNLNKDAKINKINNFRYEIQIESKDYILETFPVRKQNISSFIANGYFSEKFNKAIRNSRVVFELQTKRTFFVTTIYRKDTVEISDVAFARNLLEFKNRGQNVEIKL